MTKLKMRPMLSLLLALVMVVTMLPMTALAADELNEHICTDETCTHEHTEEIATDETSTQEYEQTDETEASDVYNTQSDAEIPEAVDPVASNEVLVAEAPEISAEADDSGLEWDFDADCGELFIYGSGAPEAFTSVDDQPWAAFRESIVAVHMDDYDGLTVDSIAYWFSGCVNLEYAEIAASVREIGYHAFNNCKALQYLIFFHEETFPTFVQGAFITNHPIDWTKGYDPRLHITVMEDWMLDNICAFDWGEDDCHVTASNDYGGATTFALTATPLATSRAVGYCSYCKTTCAYTEAYEQWTASVHCHRLWCSNCGNDQAGGVLGEAHVFSHYNSSYDRCTYCGYLTACTCAPACTHPSYTTTWVTSCQWERYCSSCGAYLGSGTTHGPYTYGSWTYYSTSQHRRSYTCSYGDSGTYYEYGSHSLATQYTQYSSTQHSVRSYCATCGSYVGSTSYANHSFTYGAWQPYSATQHRRTVSCSTCGYSTYEYANHSLTYGAWASISETQHQRTGSCSCGHSMTETGAHTDADGDGYCDDCKYLMTRFSVTVPASLSLVVSKTGETYAASNAAISNNSTGTVEVTAVTVSTVNGWTLVPYNTGMATAKVDAKFIGFSLNGAQSAATGSSEMFSLPGTWSIPSGNSLPLSYDAVVSAMSEAANEQVLTVIFVLEWA